MSGAVFDLTLASGRKLVGVRVHGRGGEMGADITRRTRETARGVLKLLECYGRLAAEGHRLPIYESQPGHVRVYVGPWKGNLADEVIEVVDLRGARASNARWS